MGNLLKYNIDWNKDFQTNDFKPLPAGLYGAKVIKEEIKDTKAGNGSYLSLTLSLLGGKGVKGRRVFEIHMLEHPKPTVVNIGRQSLKDLSTALGLDFDEVVDTSIFLDKVVGVELSVEENEEYGDKNRVKKYVEFDDSMLEGGDTSTDDSIFS